MDTFATFCTHLCLFIMNQERLNRPNQRKNPFFVILSEKVTPGHSSTVFLALVVTDLLL